MSTICATITLFGPLTAREQAKLLLENQPQVRRIDSTPNQGRLRLFLSTPIREDDLVDLLASSGISGFRLNKR